MYLLDTDTCIDVLRDQPMVVSRLGEILPEDCAISGITTFELLSGVANARNPAAEAERVGRFLDVIGEVPFERRDAEVSARIRADLIRRGLTIGPYDLLIAGQAIAHGLTLVTSNLREFQRVDGLVAESWR